MMSMVTESLAGLIRTNPLEVEPMHKKYYKPHPIPTRKAVFPIGPSLAYIPLTRGLFAVVDWDDALWLEKHNWCAVPWGRPQRKKWYAARSVNGKQLSMHRSIMGAPCGVEIDHVLSVQTLNNMRFNLRPATDLQNAANAKLRSDSTTGFKGRHI
jgi:hypothetical protein